LTFLISARANNPKVNFREKEKKILDQILGAGKYDARIRPSGINGTGKRLSSISTHIHAYKKI
jgi:hypothetical protein